MYNWQVRRCFAVCIGQWLSKAKPAHAGGEEIWKEWLKEAKYDPKQSIDILDQQSKKNLPGQQNNHDTIGMVALDARPEISAGACTTSGMAFKMHGRVGDSPIIGAGLFVDNEVGAAASTGVGEEVVKICGSHTVVELMRQGLSPELACRKTVERMVPKRRQKQKTFRWVLLPSTRLALWAALHCKRILPMQCKQRLAARCMRQRACFEQIAIRKASGL
jgi:hypothetical protein